MPGNRMGENTKEKILEVARQEFLEKGFEAARVEDIARRAGITKAMLYYHFNTKENIYNEMLTKLIAEVRREFQANMSPVNMSNREQFLTQLKAMIAFYQQRQDIIRLVLAEQFSHRDPGNASQLSMFKDVFDLIVDLAREAPGRDEEVFLIQIFFFNALPMLLFASLSDRFCSDFDIRTEKCMHVFADTFARLYQNAAAKSG